MNDLSNDFILKNSAGSENLMIDAEQQQNAAEKVQTAYLVHQGLISFFAGVNGQFQSMMQTANINAKTADAFLTMFEQHIKDLSDLKFRIGITKSNGHAELENLIIYCKEKMTFYEVQHCLNEFSRVQQAENNADRKYLKYQLRKMPITPSFDEDFKTIFRLDENLRPFEYVKNDYFDNGDGTITDRATGLMWQMSGSSKDMDYESAKAYIANLNHFEFAGYKDWRLPTVDELMSLLTPKNHEGFTGGYKDLRFVTADELMFRLKPERNRGDLYIDPIFEGTQGYCCTSDQCDLDGLWIVSFREGCVSWGDIDSYVRAVRSVQ
ncbi:MAG: hypothetical protein BWK80_13645 [Desulfobacteraceae bacterium IS3]|nr:MAG: hypothetical protein BWK80_13645 [Desulfobacteraceae bacterium IS3]HAO21988.1 hypothetical protein [Desulfobacteraceae bacterium]